MKKLLIPAIVVSVALLAVLFRPSATSPVMPLASAQSAALPVASSLDKTGTPVVADWKNMITTRWKTGPEFGRIESSDDGLRLITTEQPQHIYSLQAQMVNEIALAKGDTMLIRFAARSLQSASISGSTKLGVGMGKASPDWDRSYKGEVSLSAQWQRYDIPFTCQNDFAPGEAQITFTFGYPAQQAEIADVKVLRFGPQVTLASLPKTKRRAEEVAPAIVQGELKRIAEMKSELEAIKNPAPANGTIISVAKTGSATGNGSKQKPFATIGQALAIVKPGDTIQKSARANLHRTQRHFDPRLRAVPTPGFIFRPRPARGPNWLLPIGAALNCAKRHRLYRNQRLRAWNGCPDAEALNAGQSQSAFTVRASISPMYALASRPRDFTITWFTATAPTGIGTLDCDYVTVEGNTVYDLR